MKTDGSETLKQKPERIFEAFIITVDFFFQLCILVFNGLFSFVRLVAGLSIRSVLFPAVDEKIGPGKGRQRADNARPLRSYDLAVLRFYEAGDSRAPKCAPGVIKIKIRKTARRPVSRGILALSSATINVNRTDQSKRAAAFDFFR